MPAAGRGRRAAPRHVASMTKNPRPWLPLATALLLLPVLAAPSASAGSCPKTYDSGSATGEVYVMTSSDTHTRYPADSVTWVDDCGGKGCDDRVAGVYRTRDGVAYYFNLEEYRLEDRDDCFVHCVFDRPDRTREERHVSGSLDKVIPQGADGVQFSCGSFFHGSAESTEARVMFALAGLA